MHVDFLLKVAVVIDETAAFIDGQEAVKQAAVKTARDTAIESLAVQFEAATGDELPADVRLKLAASDEDVLSTVSRLVANTGAVESMGSSSSKTGSVIPQTKQERADAAFNNFGNFINS